MAYKHGIFSSERATSITPPVTVDGNLGISVCIGTAPTHLATSPAKVNTPILVNSYKEAVQNLGYSEDFERWTICEAMNVFFVLFGVAPVVFINVFDESKHYTEENFVAEGIEHTPANIGSDAILGTLKVTSGVDKSPDKLVKDTDFSIITETETTEIDEDLETEVTVTKIKILSLDKVTDNLIYYSYKNSDDAVVCLTATVQVGTEITVPDSAQINTLIIESGGSICLTLKENEDYIAERDTDTNVIVTLLDDAKVENDTIKISYHAAAPEKVTMFDIIGGIDTVTGDVTGLELIEAIYPRLGVLPGSIICPKYSMNPAVAAVMKAKAKSVNETFKTIAIVDIDTDDAPLYTQAGEVKAKHNLVDAQLIVCYPMLSLGGVKYHLSTQLAALMNQIDVDSGGLPYNSPSNKNLQCDSTVRKDGTEIYLGLAQANYLNGQGIVTALNFTSWKAWGSRTSIFPTNADPKDAWIPVRRVFNFISNTLILSFWSRIDNPLNRRLVSQIVTSANIWLDSLTAAEALLGGQVSFLEEDNSVSNLMDGRLTFRVQISPPVPAEQITFTSEYDVNAFSALFS